MIEIPDIGTFGLTQEDLLKAHPILTADLSTKKTSFQLDLEFMSRKPIIVPKVGDKVKIKSREWYKKWKLSNGTVPVHYSFVEEMAKYCGQVLTVKECRLDTSPCRFKLQEDGDCKTWSLEMFEEVYPQGTLLEVSGGLVESTYKRQCDLIQERIGEKEFELQTIKRHRFIKLEKL